MAEELTITFGWHVTQPSGPLISMMICVCFWKAASTTILTLKLYLVILIYTCTLSHVVSIWADFDGTDSFKLLTSVIGINIFPVKLCQIIPLINHLQLAGVQLFGSI